MARRRDLFLSTPELKAEALRRVHSRGRVYLREAATILGWSHKRVRGDVDQGKIATIQWGQRQVILLDELDRLRKQYDNQP